MARLRLRDEHGTTLTELLVVILMVAILLAIVLPAFLDQRAKGEDTDAKATLRTAVTALASRYIQAEDYAATAADLRAEEPALSHARALTVAGDDDSYELSERSGSGTTFTLAHDAGGRETRDCSLPGHGLCRADVDADGNRW